MHGILRAYGGNLIKRRGLSPVLELHWPQPTSGDFTALRSFAAPTAASFQADAIAGATDLPSARARSGGQDRVDGLNPRSSARWPFLRNTALIAEILQFVSPASNASTPSQLWITGAKGSGASTTVQAAIGGRATTGPGVSGADTSPAGSVVVSFDCLGWSADGPESARNSDAKLLTEFCLQLRLQLASKFEDAVVDEAQIRALVRSVVDQCPDITAGIVATVEAVGSRAGLPGMLPMGTEMPQVRTVLDKHRSDPVWLVAEVSHLMATGSRRLLLVPQATALHVALAIIQRAGTSFQGSVPGPAAMSASTKEAARILLRPADCLLAAATGLAAVANRHVVLVLLGAEELTRSQRMAPRPLRASLLKTIEQRVSIVNDDTETRLRLLLHARDAFAAVRARAAGIRVICAGGWSERMAKAVFVPRFLEAEDEAGWRATWAAVGGHPAHLRLVADLLTEERRRLKEEEQKQRMAQQRSEMLKQLRPEVSADSEEKRRIAEQQEKDDSIRADAGKTWGAVESLLRRLPAALNSEVEAFEKQMRFVMGHRLLHDLRRDLQERPGETSANLVSALRALCLAKSIPAEPGSNVDADSATGYLLVLAMLDGGLLVPYWSDASKSELVVANKLTLDMLMAWTEALIDELPWKEAAACSWYLWRKQTSVEP